MAFAFVAAGTAYDSTSSASAVVPVPAGVAADDIMFAVLKHVGAAPNSDPSGWALLATDDNAISSSNHSLYWKLAGGSEPSDYTWGYAAAGRLGGKIFAFRDGFDTADPIDVVSDTAYTTNDTTCRAAGMTVAAANSPLIFFGNTHAGSAQTFTPPTNPATFTEHVDAGPGGARWNHEVASVIWTGSGATGDMDATISVSNQGKHAFAVALNPAAAGGAQNILAWIKA